jgi:hypothetical protein
VAFYTLSNNWDPRDTDFAYDVYVKDLVTGEMILASTDDGGAKANTNSFDPEISASGTIVVFDSNASNLDDGDPDDLSDIYWKDIETGELRLVSTTDGGLKGNSYSYAESISADGNRVAFVTWSTNLDSVDRDTLPDAYLKDMTTGEVTLATTTGTGTKGNGETLSTALSANGSFVAFHTSARNLDPADRDWAYDVYVKEF